MTPPPAGYRPNVGLMLLNPSGAVFAGRRVDMPGAWQMPQGGIDPGEEPAAAAMRELAEEVGTDRAQILFRSERWITYDFPPEMFDRNAIAKKGNWRGQAQLWFALRFTGTDSDIAVATAVPEFDAWQWLPRAALVSLIVPFKRAVYRAVLEEFEPKLDAIGL